MSASALAEFRTGLLRVPTRAQVLAFPVTVDIPTAGTCWGLGKDASYKRARAGQFPVPVLRIGRRLVVTRVSLLDALGISDEPAGRDPAA